MNRSPPATPGVGYVCADGTSEPIRVSGCHVTDLDIAYLTKHFAPNPQSVDIFETGNAPQ